MEVVSSGSGVKTITITYSLKDVDASEYESVFSFAVVNNKVSTSLTLSRTEGIAVERIQHLNTEFRMEVKKERYRLNLSLSSRLRAPNQNLQFIVNLMLPINAILHGFLNPCNRSLVSRSRI